MISKGLNNIDRFKAECKKFSKSSLVSSVENADKKIGDREAAGEKLRKLKSRVKREEQKPSDNIKVTKAS